MAMNESSISKSTGSDIEVKSLSYQPGSAKKPILSDVSYTFSEGHMTALLGPNGSGKTTLLKHILAQIKCPEGAVLIDGKDTNDYFPKERSRKISWVPQNSNGDSAFSVEEVVLMARYPYKGTWDGDSEEDVKIAEEAMRTVGVLELRNRNFLSLSGGERQRTLIARALAQTTPWILLDEPTSNLDIKHQIAIMDVLHKRVQKGDLSVVVVMHDFNMVERFCDRAILLKDGKVVNKGETREVMTAERISSVYETGFDIIEKDGRRFFFPKDTK
ncbi:MAG: ABC transporter ATP-binding protein [Clostridiales bacterium]|nr:ABC transporter ATP-binding protein [Clostridiales bacterium]